MFENLIKIEKLDKDDILTITKTAKAFKSGALNIEPMQKAIAMMFLENSTRTKCSFDLAAQQLGAYVVNFETTTSSFSKGETIKDTIENLYAIGIRALVVRSGENGLLQKTIDQADCKMRFINAGEGNQSHPTQALLDYLTMIEHLVTMEGKKVVIVGDIAHSRVAKSNIALLHKFGADVNLCAPSHFKDDTITNATWHNNLPPALKNADVVMALRMQKERHSNINYDFENYVKEFQLTTKRLEELAPNAILMHPGPINRDVEMSSELLDSNKGKTILQQAQNGTFIRMAVLYHILKEVE